MSVVVITFTQASRTNVKVAAALVESARAEAFADAGVHVAILELVGTRDKVPPTRRFPLDGTPQSCSMGKEGAVAISVQDEAGKVDLNIGSEQVVRAMILGLGGGESMAEAILDYRDEDDRRRASGAEVADYRAAGRAAGPRNGPFLATEELSNVLGLTQVDAERISSFTTIYSGQAGIDTSVASKALVDTVRRGVERGGLSTFGEGPTEDAETEPGLWLGAPLPSLLLAASTRRAFSIRAEARTGGGAVFVREAVIEFPVPNAPTYVLRRWRRGAASGFTSAPDALPPC
jgi:general secretion pathway protein K